jgi:hypothetical protein
VTDLKSQLQIVLQDAGYDTWLSAIEHLEIVGFEDDTVMGFACIFDDVASMLERWRRIETRLLNHNAPSLHRAGDKTWNLYSVFLSQAIANDGQSREIRWIEEDMERTRKLAACGVVDQSTLVAALLPLLPLQSQPSLDREDFDVTQRLVRRIGTIAPPAASVALDPKVNVTEVIRLLGVDL